VLEKAELKLSEKMLCFLSWFLVVRILTPAKEVIDVSSTSKGSLLVALESLILITGD